MDLGYPLHLVVLLAIVCRKQLSKVKVAGTLSGWFRVKKGVRQGCVLSPYLIIQERIRVKTETEIADEQAGFRQGRGTRDQITNLRILMHKAREYQQPLCAL